MIGAVPKALDVALIDVGGTLWPNSWPFRETDGAGRHERVGAAMPALDPVQVDALVADLIASCRIGDEARAISTETPATIAAAEVLIAGSLARQGLPADAQTIARIRRAMALPVADRMKPLPGATELLAEIRALGLRTVIASNTYSRDAPSHWDDFRLPGIAGYFHATVTPVDPRPPLPHPASHSPRRAPALRPPPPAPIAPPPPAPSRRAANSSTPSAAPPRNRRAPARTLRCERPPRPPCRGQRVGRTVDVGLVCGRVRCAVIRITRLRASGAPDCASQCRA